MASYMPGGIATGLMIPPVLNAIPVQEQSIKQKCSDIAKGNKIRTIVVSTIAFAILSHLTAYRIAEGINNTVTGIPNGVLSEYDQPTARGTFFMTCAFLVVMVYLAV